MLAANERRVRHVQQVGEFSDQVFLEFVDVVVGVRELPQAGDQLPFLLLAVVLVDQRGELVIIGGVVARLFRELDQFVLLAGL